MSSAKTIVSTRISQDTKQDLEKLALLLNRDRSWVVEEALKDFIEREKQFLEAVEDGLLDVNKGQTVSHTQVLQNLKELHKKYPRTTK